MLLIVKNYRRSDELKKLLFEAEGRKGAYKDQVDY